MQPLQKSTLVLVGLSLFLTPLLGEEPQRKPWIAYRKADGADERKTLLLRDYKPVSTLHVPVHNVYRPRFRVIDFHTHFNDAEGVAPAHFPPHQVVEVMDQCNIQKAVILTGMWGDRLQKVLDGNVKPYPDRFVVFVQLDDLWEKVDESNFGELMVSRLRDGVTRGARGLKLDAHLGLDVYDKFGNLVSMDDARFDLVWDECGRLGIPVSIHVADPDPFFIPNGPTNERYEQLIDYPDWHHFGPNFPSKETIMEAAERIYAKHPNTTFVAVHAGSRGGNLDRLSDMLNRYPNVVVDIASRLDELGRQPRRARKFFLEFEDRILFGTDASAPDAEGFRFYFRWLETYDEYFGSGRWKIYGIGLPDSVLEKVYHLNAEKILSQFKGLSGVRPESRASRSY